jgi:ABC-type multidrug transport system permease subunit
MLVVFLRFFKQYLLLLAVNQMAASLFRFIGGAARNMIVANVFASFMLLVVMVLGGFILVRGRNSHLSLPLSVLCNAASSYSASLYLILQRKSRSGGSGVTGFPQ